MSDVTAFGDAITETKKLIKTAQQEMFLPFESAAAVRLLQENKKSKNRAYPMFT